MIAGLSLGAAIGIYAAACIAGAALCLQQVWDAARNGVLVTPATHLYLESNVGPLLLLNLCISCYATVSWLITVACFGSLTSQELRQLWRRLAKFLTFRFVISTSPTLVDLPSFSFCICWYALAVLVHLFLGVAKDRLEALKANPLVTRQQQVRPFSLVLLLGAANAGAAGVLWVWRRELLPSQLLLLGYEAAMSAMDAGVTASRYLAHLLEHALESAHDIKPRWVPRWAALNWEQRSSAMYHLELCGDLSMHSMALVHHTYVLLQHGLRSYMASLLLMLGIKGCAGSLWQRLQEHRSFRAATERLNAACVLVSHEDVAGEDCAICRDALYGARQLHCGHCFHMSCLRALLQQTGPGSFCCPLCRRRVLPSSTTGSSRQASAAFPAAWAPSAGLSRSSSQDSDLHNNGLGVDDDDDVEEEEDLGSLLGSERQQVQEDRAYARMLQQQEQQMYEQEQEELRQVHQLLEREYGAARNRGLLMRLLTGAWLLHWLRRPAAPVSAAAAAGIPQPTSTPSQYERPQPARLLAAQQAPRRNRPPSPVNRAAAAHPRARAAPARKKGLAQLLQQQALAAWGWVCKALRRVAQPVMERTWRSRNLQAGRTVHAAATATGSSLVRRQRQSSTRSRRSA